MDLLYECVLLKKNSVINFPLLETELTPILETPFLNLLTSAAAVRRPTRAPSLRGAEMTLIHGTGHISFHSQAVYTAVVPRGQSLRQGSRFKVLLPLTLSFVHGRKMHK